MKEAGWGLCLWLLSSAICLGTCAGGGAQLGAAPHKSCPQGHAGPTACSDEGWRETSTFPDFGLHDLEGAQSGPASRQLRESLRDPLDGSLSPWKRHLEEDTNARWERSRVRGKLKGKAGHVLSEATALALSEEGDTEVEMEMTEERSTLVLQSRKERKGRQSRSRQSRPAARLPCKIYILDLAEIAAEHGLPACDLSNFVAEKFTQIPLLKEVAEERKLSYLPHYFTANSGPWFLYDTMVTQGLNVKDPDSADIIYVHDYCYKMWWLARVHSRPVSEEDESRPGNVLLELYKHMMDGDLWKRHNGSNFVFFQSHTGFAKYYTGTLYERMLCRKFGNSHHFINVRAQRYRCKAYNESNFSIVPSAVHVQELVNFYDMERELLQMAKTMEEKKRIRTRDTLIFFRGKCTPVRSAWATDKVNHGKLMRRDIALQVRDAGPDVQVECTGAKEELGELQAKPITHDQQVHRYFKSIFCLMLPGDSQTSRRLPEAVMTGCIPVFVGPPYHTMPLTNALDYSKFALFFNVTGEASWNVNQTIRWELDLALRCPAPTFSEFWVPDMKDIFSYTINVPSVMDMVGYLRTMNHQRIRQLQVGLRAVRALFLYMALPGKEGGRTQTASHVLIGEMCRRSARLKEEWGVTPIDNQ
eukprot:jgi/Botrbrau1/11053/Bobra.92_2s0024.1